MTSITSGDCFGIYLWISNNMLIWLLLGKQHYLWFSSYSTSIPPPQHAFTYVPEHTSMCTHGHTRFPSIILPYRHFEYLHSYDYIYYLELRLEKTMNPPTPCTFGFPWRKQLSFFLLLSFLCLCHILNLSQLHTSELTFHLCQVFDHLYP